MRKVMLFSSVLVAVMTLLATHGFASHGSISPNVYPFELGDVYKSVSVKWQGPLMGLVPDGKNIVSYRASVSGSDWVLIPMNAEVLAALNRVAVMYAGDEQVFAQKGIKAIYIMGFDDATSIFVHDVKVGNSQDQIVDPPL